MDNRRVMDMTNRPEYVRAPYGFESSYKAEGLDHETRQIYHEFNLAKAAANNLLAELNVPLLLRFRPTEDSVPTGVWSNMELHVYYIRPDNYKEYVHKHKLSLNEIRIDAHARVLALKAMQTFDKCPYNHDILRRAKAAEAYETAY